MGLFIVGAGHVGLVTAVGFARLGHHVTVSDIDPERIRSLGLGRSPFYEPGLDDGLREAVESGGLSYTHDPLPPPDAAVTFVCTATAPTSIERLPMDSVEAVLDGLLVAAAPDHVVAVRSTLPLHGVTRLRGILGAHAGPRPRVVVNPEFMREATALADFARPSRVLVGWLEDEDRAAAVRVAELFAPLEAPTVVTDASSVAIAKLAANSFLAAKVTFANEVARICDALGADATTVLGAVGMDPRIGSAFLAPGPGVGGSCLPDQVAALADDTRRRGIRLPLLQTIGEANEVHAEAIVERLGHELADEGGLIGNRICLLGLAFKSDTDDVSASPALRLAAALRRAGAWVTAYDPRVTAEIIGLEAGVELAPDPGAAVAGTQAVLITTEWPEFASLTWAQLAKRMRGDLVFDTRRIADPDAVGRAGLRYLALGRADGLPVAAHEILVRASTG
jgi:UDPglucose 6-dehydrogenase